MPDSFNIIIFYFNDFSYGTNIPILNLNPHCQQIPHAKQGIGSSFKCIKRYYNYFFIFHNIANTLIVIEEYPMMSIIQMMLFFYVFYQILCFVEL